MTKSPSEMIKEHSLSLPVLGRGSKPGSQVDLFSNPPSLAKVPYARLEADSNTCLVCKPKPGCVSYTPGLNEAPGDSASSQ